MDIALGILAGLMHIIAFVIYNKQMIQGTSSPNVATWTAWSFLTFLNLGSYLVMSGDFIKSLLPLASSLATLFTFIFAIAKGKFSRIDKWDGISLVIGLFAGFVWWYYSSAMYANFILQASIVVSFIPTYRGLWINPRNETPLPWVIWAGAYILSLVVVFLRWNNQLQDIAYPVVCFVLHIVVAILSKRKLKTMGV